MKLISGGDDVIIKDIDKNVRFLLLKNDSKLKMMNKIERLNFYKKINKVFDDINIINKKYFYFNKSLIFFTPLVVFIKNWNYKLILNIFFQYQL